MVRDHARRWWACAFGVLAGVTLLTRCASIPLDHTVAMAPQPVVPQYDDDDWSQLIAQLRTDLNRNNNRILGRSPGAATNGTMARRDQEFADRARALFAPLNGTALRMPVVGVRAQALSDSWHDPRDGGSRVHKGIDIFAPRGAEVVAVSDGIVSYIGDQPKGGHCVWLSTENGASFFYAHLDRWAPGLYEGMEVQAGDLLGFVGNTGNAVHTPSHLHFGINQGDDMVNPYPLLSHAAPSMHARVHAELGGGFGTR